MIVIFLRSLFLFFISDRYYALLPTPPTPYIYRVENTIFQMFQIKK